MVPLRLIHPIIGLLFVQSVTFCADETPETPDAQPTVVEDVTVDRFAPRAVTVDAEPPVISGRFTSHVIGWGRVEFSWAPASDDQTPPGQLVYRLSGRGDFVASAIAGHHGEAVSIRSAPGQTVLVAVVPQTHSIWHVVAIDEAGNESLPSLPIEIRTTPLVRNLQTGAINADLTECARWGAQSLVCVGLDGRYSIWDGDTWHERVMDNSSTVAIVQGSDEFLLSSPITRYRLDEGSTTAEELQSSFVDAPNRPFHRLSVEPSGLFFWLDSNGSIWVAEQSEFRRLDNPFLLPPDELCATVIDIVFSANRGFARCQDNTQFVLTADEGIYRWSRLAEANTLDAMVLPQRGVVFGEGRQMSLLTWSGDAWRYDMGGWQRLSDEQITAIATGEHRYETWAAHQQQIVRYDAMGAAEPLVALHMRAPAVFLEPSLPDGRAVSSLGELYDLNEGTPLRELPPNNLAKIIPTESGTPTVLVADPFGLYAENEQQWTLQPLPSLPEDFLVHDVVAEGAGNHLFVGDGGLVGGQIFRQVADVVSLEPFLYPAPPPPPPESDGEEPTGPDPTGDAGTEPLEPLTPIWTCISPDLLPDPPPTPPPLRAIDIDPSTDTAVTVGEGGSVWMRTEAGWCQVNTGSTLPLLAVRVIGPNEFVAAGIGGFAFHCIEAECSGEEVGVGDVQRLIWDGDSLVALGSNGVATRHEDTIGAASWVPMSIEFESPFPSGELPEQIIDIQFQPDHRWLLTSDGSLWWDTNDTVIAMAHVDEPLGLWLEPDGAAVVVSQEGMYRVSPPAN